MSPVLFQVKAHLDGKGIFCGILHLIDGFHLGGQAI